MEFTWKNRLLPVYEIRKTYAQKTAFIRMLEERYGKALYVEKSGHVVKSRNLVFGCPETAEVIFSAHYDTCARLPFPNFITPRNLPLYIVYQLFLSLFLLLPPVLCSVLTAVLCRHLPEGAGLFLTELALFAAFGVEIGLLLAGPANPHTANDNTSGVVTVLELLDRLGTERTAFILFDNEEKGLLGSAAYAQRHPDLRQNRLLINLDCVSDGDTFLFAFTKAARKTDFYRRFTEQAAACLGEPQEPQEPQKLQKPQKKLLCVPAASTVYPSDQASFRTSAAVAALHKAPVIGYYMDKIHTPRDVIFEDANIVCLTELFIRLLSAGEPTEEQEKNAVSP